MGALWPTLKQSINPLIRGFGAFCRLLRRYDGLAQIGSNGGIGAASRHKLADQEQDYRVVEFHGLARLRCAMHQAQNH